MKKILISTCLAAVLFTSCSKDLAIENPNSPTPASLESENGIVNFATGGVYTTGFKSLKYTDGVFGPFWSGATGFHELMGDVIGCDAANAFMNALGCPQSVTHDDASTVINPNSPNTQKSLLRQVNVNQQAGNNFVYYEWAQMYNLIGACNLLLEKVDAATYVGDAASKKAAIKAWANWWKGFAYSRIGSTYYAGLIVNTAFGSNGNYVTKEKMIQEANATLDKAVADANSAPSATVFTETWGKIIPTIFQVGNGGPLSPTMLAKHVSSLKARNLLVSKTTASMTSADWTSVLSLANSGLISSDKIFTVRSDARGDLFFSSQLIMGRTYSTSPGGATYKISERLIQEFKPGDRRKDNNFTQGTPYTGQSDRGNAHFTRWSLVNGGNGIAGVVIYANGTPGAFEMPISVSYEENQLMKAEAHINLGGSGIETGLGIIDALRNSQGAGLAAVAGTGLTQAQAREELRRERRIVIALRGLSFWDARRWGVATSSTGRTGCVALKNTGSVSNNATIVYNFLDFWDVPGNELTYNPPAAGSAPVVNPN